MDFRFSNADIRLEQARIVIDGKAVEVGRVVPNAPFQVEGLEVGTRTVEITHPDYEPWRQSVTVRDEQTTAVAVKLTPRPGRLAIRAEPREIALTINGRAVRSDEMKNGELTLPAGEALALVASAQGYKSAARTFTLAANGREMWAVELELSPSAPPTAAPSASTAPSGPTAGQRWANTLGMKFVPVPGVAVLFCIWETRVQDYQAFVNETQREWPKPEFPQGATHPAVLVNADDATAFCAWLTEKERKAARLASNQAYRLPTDAEWDAAVGKDLYPWGKGWPPPKGAGNYADNAALRGRYSSWGYSGIIPGYEDGYDATAPVGSFTANRFGIYDLGGNVWERVGDRRGGVRGASFFIYVRGSLDSSVRLTLGVQRYDRIGFRVVCVVGPAP